MMYRMLVGMDYDPTGKRYEKGRVDALRGWKKAHIENALKSGRIERVKDEVGSEEAQCLDRS